MNAQVQPVPASQSYARVQARKDLTRLVTALRAEADRLEGKARAHWYVQFPARRGVAVTDHALVRFLERVMGIDMDAIRTEIARLVPDAALPMETLSTPDRHGLVVVDGFQFLVTPNSLISVLTEDMDATCWLGLLNRADFLDGEGD